MRVTYLVRARKFLWAVAATAIFATAGCGGSSSLSKDGGRDGASPDLSTIDDHVRNHQDAHPDAQLKCDGGARIVSGEACGCGADCQSGFCADGVCCDSACGDTCKACNVPGAMGTCSFVPEGLKPRAAATCPAGDVTACGLDGTCDGQGACRKYVAGTVCGKGTCNGAAVTGIQTCDGSGACKPGDAKICVPFTCDTTTQDCSSTCVTSADCAPGHDCTNGSCGLKMKGISCVKNEECESGFCTDGVCCAVACQGACLTCNQTGRLGTCWPIDAGNPDPRGVCKDGGAMSCGQTGACDGFGACAKYAAETICVLPSCAADKLDTAGTCDGVGTCKPPGLQDCTPYRCVSGACNPTCTTDADCVAGIACIKNSCGLKKPGGTCTKGTDCASGFCTDGVCCNEACGGACRSCALASSRGTCTPLTQGTADNRGVCKDQGAGSCGTNGRCDGAGGCGKYASGTVCAGEKCATNVYTGPSTCSSTGQCVAPSSVPCAPYACNGTKCFDSCTVTTNCVSPNVCNVNSCGLKGPGASCGAGTECASKVCAQGVCCVTTCAASCKACNLPSSMGTCTNVPTGTVDPKAICVDQGSPSCGTNGRCVAGACQKYSAGTSCKGATCPSGTVTFTAQSTCDGAGTCNTPGAKSCFPFACGAATNACNPTCTTNAQCAPNASCLNGSCGLKPPGGQCASTAECASGLVCSAQNVCCNAMCNGPCVSCVLSATLGTCSPVAANATDPSGQCGVTAPSSCGNDGECDGKGACQKFAAGTQCVPPSCPANTSTVTLAKTCDGTGNCSVGGSMSSCGTFLCNGANNSCNQTCAFNTDCVAPNTCVGNLCGKKPAGAPCATSDQCVSGLTCTDGFCCNTGNTLGTCGSCRACDATGSCQNTTAACTTSNKCFVMSGTCSGGACVSAPVTCNDNNPCTTDSCDPMVGCVFTPVTNGTTCNDNNACTLTDTCQNGTCTGSNLKTCPADQCHGAESCNSATGVCSGAALPDGTPCSDGNACTVGDSCLAGACTGGAAKTCSATDQCHVGGTCDPASGSCSNPAKTNGATCNDGNACTQVDTCQAGSCIGMSPISCAATDQCHVAGTCDPSNGSCSNPVKSDGSVCNDGNACTQSDTCQSGTCTGSNPIVCQAADQCHVAGTCNPSNGACSNPVASDGSGCNDGNACTQTDTCSSGTCTGSNPKACQAADQCHVAGTCNPSDGTCSNPTQPDGTACANPDLCNADSCVLGVCVSACTDGTACDPVLGCL